VVIGPRFALFFTSSTALAAAGGGVNMLQFGKGVGPALVDVLFIGVHLSLTNATGGVCGTRESRDGGEENNLAKHG
jgi:hypothetical protein